MYLTSYKTLYFVSINSEYNYGFLGKVDKLVHLFHSVLFTYPKQVSKAHGYSTDEWLAERYVVLNVSVILMCIGWVWWLIIITDIKQGGDRCYHCESSNCQKFPIWHRKYLSDYKALKVTICHKCLLACPQCSSATRGTPANQFMSYISWNPGVCAKTGGCLLYKSM